MARTSLSPEFPTARSTVVAIRYCSIADRGVLVIHGLEHPQTRRPAVMQVSRMKRFIGLFFPPSRSGPESAGETIPDNIVYFRNLSNCNFLRRGASFSFSCGSWTRVSTPEAGYLKRREVQESLLHSGCPIPFPVCFQP